ncbi:MAG: Lrp/AsnC family transcriptional regulator [Candidatus Eremiobacteraeota bacterium]|nr:Lrp/AsnC family transcriptional regulator [Candidatus Eremiobacteraeota bacterium]
MPEQDADDLDVRLIDALQNNALSTLAELGALVGLKRPAVHERIKRLEDRGYIIGYGAKIDYARLGLGLVALVSIYTLPGIEYERFYNELAALPEVTVVYSVAGEESFVVNVVTRSTGHLDDFLARLQSVRGIARTKTAVVLSTPFARRSVPVERLMDDR